MTAGALLSSSIIAMRSLGYIGSSGTYAAPNENHESSARGNAAGRERSREVMRGRGRDDTKRALDDSRESKPI
jgi:hypothetical protein